MKIKTIQWNIGGGKTRRTENDPLLDESYIDDGILCIIETIKKHSPDIIFLQETHHGRALNQVRAISELTGLPFYFSDIYDHSHLERGQDLGQGIISRFPLKNHEFKFFVNPKLEIVRPNGEKWFSHDKGISTCLANVGATICLKTLHSFPPRRFGIEPMDEALTETKKSMAEKIKCTEDYLLLGGDFNYNGLGLKEYLPQIFLDGVEEIALKEPTTARGHWHDRMLYKGVKHIYSEVISGVLTDHFPICSEFEI